MGGRNFQIPNMPKNLQKYSGSIIFFIFLYILEIGVGNSIPFYMTLYSCGYINRRIPKPAVRGGSLLLLLTGEDVFQLLSSNFYQP